ncbi:xanthine dehydrogenase accessory protein XdhC [Vibrio hepatarius]|uniref:xanthine dehydrogenase accessory protein XdhC n=1 Tax=Vibrio hepatarius TaxID=171383 RepID=UPI001C0A3986|nr:xanthine dehydrogenase accessory protein XdhC [Vibrio hepatarius]MBU2896638.1 xanthine dehydrogenase accessory protein XdhC [Vibrio hepatarius]
MHNDNWIHELAQLEKQHEPCVIVTIIETHGSAPRTAGTKMLITGNRLIATIGGGHLEHLATDIARQMLLSGETYPKLERFNLGSRLGQCCGGMVTLSFEPISPNAKHLVIFGAGHVAQALLHVVSTLPFRVTWIDQRDEIFPNSIPARVTKLVSDDPVFEISSQPSGSYYLVMTHNHQLDFELARAILDKGDSTYFGIIGSQSKRKRFDMRLAQRGYSQQQIDTMVCPIGLSAVDGKHPAEIAVSIAGELIMHYQGLPLEKKRSTSKEEHHKQADISMNDSIA